jgi:hypothetical protein
VRSIRLLLLVLLVLLHGSDAGQQAHMCECTYGD